MDKHLTIANVYIWENGMVMVFDNFGQQMPEYQGRVDEVWDKIQTDKTPETIILGARIHGSNFLTGTAETYNPCRI